MRLLLSVAACLVIGVAMAQPAPELAQKRLASMYINENLHGVYFEYNDKGQITAIKRGSKPENAVLFTTFTYPSDKEVMVENFVSEISKVRHTLNDDRNVVETRTMESNFTRSGERTDIVARYAYDQAGNIVRIEKETTTYSREIEGRKETVNTVEEFIWNNQFIAKKIVRKNGQVVNEVTYEHQGEGLMSVAEEPYFGLLPYFANFWNNKAFPIIRKASGFSVDKYATVRNVTHPPTVSFTVDRDGYVLERVVDVGNNGAPSYRTIVYQYVK